MFTYAVLFVVSVYLCYYFSKCRRPVIFAGKSSLLPEKLLEECPILSEVFFPNFLFTLPDMQSLTRELTDCITKVKLTTTTTAVILPDGGQVSYTEPTADYKIEKRLIFVLVPGYMGDHKTNYVLHLAEILLHHGIWPVIFTDRGKGGMNLKSAKFFSAGYNDGLAAVMDTIMDDNPAANYGVIGISFGGMVAVNTLYNYHRREELVVQILLSTPLESMQTVHRLNSTSRAKLFYSKPFGSRIKKLLAHNESVFSATSNDKKLFKGLLRSESMTDIDEEFIAPMFGYKSAAEYYQDICLTKCLRDIDIFTICINSDDDPCFCKTMYPREVIEGNPKVCLVTTTAGGHYGFAGLGWPFTHATYSDKMVAQITSMILADVT